MPCGGRIQASAGVTLEAGNAPLLPAASGPIRAVACNYFFAAGGPFSGR